MVRWEPDARDRLSAAALELYAAQGFDDTTVADIAKSVGLTERTFFRHFADKREVIFGRQDTFQHSFTDVIATTEGTPRELVTAAITAGAAFFAEERRDYSRLRNRVISAHPELRERELLKMNALANATADALRERGVQDPVATLAAEQGVLVFRVSFARWLEDDETRTLGELIAENFAQLLQL
jgi:AcrR family transcriptional regulator